MSDKSRYNLEESNESARRSFASSIINSIDKLVDANVLVGIWDNLRFRECLKPINDVNLMTVYKSEIFSRRNVELRAKYRNKIEFDFCDLVESID